MAACCFRPICVSKLRAVLLSTIVSLGACAGRPAPTDYLVDTWRFDDDLPRDGINSIAQGSDGYLWVSSRYGLARFDGVRFVNFDARTGAHFIGHHFATLTPDRFGDVWIGTPGGGLAEWEGGRLLPCLPPGTPEIGPVFAGLTNAQGRELAIAPDGRVLGWSNNVAELIVDAGRWGGVVSPSLCQDTSGAIWFVTYEHKLVRVNGTNAQEMTYGNGEERRNWIALAVGAAGELWAGTHRDVGVWRESGYEPISPPEKAWLPVDDIIAIPDAVPDEEREETRRSRFWVIALGRAWLLEGNRWVTNVSFEQAAGLYETSPRIVDHAGNLWFTTTKSGIVRTSPDGGLMRLTSDQDFPPGRVASLFEDRERSIWVGIEHAALVRLRERYFSPIGARQGAKAPLVWAALEDLAGAIWLGTENGGLQRWQEGKLTQFSLGNNALPGSVYSLCLDQQGRIWAGTGDNQVFRFENGKFVLVWEDPAPGWNKRVYAIYQDRAGQMWFGTGMGLFRWREGEIRRVMGKGFEVGVVRAIAQDESGRLWIGRSGGSQIRLGCVDGEEVIARGVDQGLKGYDVFGLHGDADGAMWIGTVGDGLWCHRNGEFARYTTQQRLPDDRIYSIAQDELGNLWLGSPAGIIRVEKRSLGTSGEPSMDLLECLLFNRTDGLPTRECSGGTQPVISRTRGGRLLFALTEGAVALSPGAIKVNGQPPPVVIEEVRVDGKPIANAGTRRTGPGRHVVEFRYTANSLTAPSKMRFRYRLEGVDPGWREAETGRSALYALTSPGAYRFQVIACNNDGVWNTTGASIGLVVPPYLWQTWPFRIGAFVAILVAVGGTILMVERRKMARKLAQFEMHRRLEQERARIARDIHDELGASLTEIGLLSEFAQRDSTGPEQVKVDVAKIAVKAQSSTRALDEIVWAVNPRHDTLEGFVAYACSYAEEQLRLAEIRCRLDILFPLPARPLRADLRHHLFLAFKEALNNVVKHARASQVQIRFFVEADRFNAWISDDGCGFDAAKVSTRNGLGNMRERLESTGGTWACESVPGRGTTIKLALKLE